MSSLEVLVVSLVTSYIKSLASDNGFYVIVDKKRSFDENKEYLEISLNHNQ